MNVLLCKMFCNSMRCISFRVTLNLIMVLAMTLSRPTVTVSRLMMTCLTMTLTMRTKSV